MQKVNIFNRSKFLKIESYKTSPIRSINQNYCVFIPKLRYLYINHFVFHQNVHKTSISLQILNQNNHIALQ